MLQLIYELKKNWRGRDGTGGRTDRGSIRGPRGPKKRSSHKEDKKEEILASEVLVELEIIVTR